MRYGNGYGNTSADKRAGTKNATANSTLHGSYNNPTGTPAGQTAASARGMSNELRYRLMLENAHVHDTDGFLLDGENAALQHLPVRNTAEREPAAAVSPPFFRVDKGK